METLKAVGACFRIAGIDQPSAVRVTTSLRHEP